MGGRTRVTEEVQRLAESFIRCLARECKSCFRRSETNCSGCYCRTACYIAARMDGQYAEPRTEESALVVRTRRILEILERAGRPLRANEIDVSDLCTKQVKFWTLGRMARHGTIEKRIAGGGSGSARFVYAIAGE